MGLFLSTFINKIDKKGRVSVPSAFRSAIATMQQTSPDFSGVVVYPSFVNQCVEACSIDRMAKLSESIDQMDPYSDERNAFAAAIMAACYQLPFDSEGRVILPESLMSETGLTSHAAFVGKGTSFEIWQPETFDKYMQNARNLACQQRSQLKFNKGGANE